VPEDEMAGDEACRMVDLLLAGEGVEEGGADLFPRQRPVVEPVALFARQRRRRPFRWRAR